VVVRHQFSWGPSSLICVVYLIKNSGCGAGQSASWVASHPTLRIRYRAYMMGTLELRRCRIYA
jgi:hypothetical protein